MKVRNKLVGLIALLSVAGTYFFWLSRREEVLKMQAQGDAQSSKVPGLSMEVSPVGAETRSTPNPFEALMHTPIEFYGIVLDQDGNPIPSAKVSGSVLDSWKGSPISATTGNDGKFAILSKGTAIHLRVEKSGFYHVEKGGDLRPSTQGFDFGVEDSPRAYRSDPTAPTVFHLRRANNPIPLDRLNANPKVPRDGTPITVKPSKTSTVRLQIQCLTNEDTQIPTAAYDWRCEIGVEGGGIQEATDEHAFVAPDGGYIPSAVIDMPKTLDVKHWRSRASKNYWLRFSDNTFGKISFLMIARGDHFAVISGFRNPSPNDRNLEPKLDGR